MVLEFAGALAAILAAAYLFTPWVLGPINLYSAALALISGFLVYVALRSKGPLHTWQLMVGGIFYLAFLTGAVYSVF